MSRAALVTGLALALMAAVAGPSSRAFSQEASRPSPTPQSQTAQQNPSAPQASDAQGAQAKPQSLASVQPQQGQPPDSNYNKAIFDNLVPSAQLAFLKPFEGRAANDLMGDKQFRKLMRSALPDCMFHYGHDMPLLEAMETVLHGSQEPVRIRDGRYVVVSGRSGPYLGGRGFMWIDLQDGVVLGGFAFRPTNGEPTPAVNIFSRQVREEYMAMSELPPAFAEDFNEWSRGYRVPPITPRYFITGSNKKILLEHDEDYCLDTPSHLAIGPAPGDAFPAPDSPQQPDGDNAANANTAGDTANSSECQRMNADAADIDMDAANYVEQTHHATNATAWMITGADQEVWLRVRARTCGDFVACRIRVTRARVRVIIHRPPVVHRTHK